MLKLTILRSTFLLFLITMLSIAQLNSQMLFNKSTSNNQNENIYSREINYLNWTEGKDLKKEKGWKQFARWQWLNQGRILPNGTIANDSYYLDALPKKSKKDVFLNKDNNSSWIPLGPQNFPYSHYQKMGHGVGRINCVTFHPSDPQTFWVGTPRGGIWKTNNGGHSWIPLGDDLPLMKVSDIAVDPENTDILYIALSDYAYVALDVTHRGRYNGFGLGIFKSMDGGVTWEQTSLARDPKNKELSLMMGIIIHPEETNKLIAAGTTGIFVSDDAGETWTNTSDLMIWDIKQDPEEPNVIYITSGYLPDVNINSYAAVFKSTDFGKTWTKLNIDIPQQEEVKRTELAISDSDPNYIYAINVGEDDGFHSFYKSTNSGLDWQLQMDKTNGPNLLGWYLGDSTDLGGQGIYDLTLLVNADDPNTVYSGGVNKWGTTDGGKTWNLVTLWNQEVGFSLHADHHCAKYNPLNERYYFCHDGGITYTEEVLIGDNKKVLEVAMDSTETVKYNLPTKWVDITSGLAITEFYRLDVNQHNSSQVMAGAQDNAAFYFDDGFWINCIGGDVMQTMINFNNPEIIYGSLYYGILAKSYIGGRDEYPDEVDLCDTISRKEKEKGEWVTPFFMHPNDPETIYSGFGNLWKSTDGGISWNKKSNFPKMAQEDYPTPIFSMGYCYNKPENIVIYKKLFLSYGEVGQLWKTNDEGDNWANISYGLPLDKFYINDIAVNNDKPDEMVIVMSGFVENEKVYFTKDGGKTWINISKNLPNLPVNAVAHQPNSSIYYIGTDNGVYYISDFESEWIEFDENLPNTLVSDLVINPKSNKIFASTFGRGIWENTLVQISDVVDISNSTDIKVSPNPVIDNLLIQFTNPFTDFKVVIIDIMGRIVYNMNNKNFADNNLNIKLDIPSGVYFLKIIDNNGASYIVRKFLKG